MAHHTISDTSQTNIHNIDTVSVVSTLEQDRKKIQLLQTNLALEKEYN